MVEHIIKIYPHFIYGKYLFKSFLNEWIIVMKPVSGTITTRQYLYSDESKYLEYNASHLLIVAIINKFPPYKSVTKVTAQSKEKLKMKVGCIIFDNNGICTSEKRGVSFVDVIDMAYYDQILNIKSYSGKYIEWKNGIKILEGEYLFGMKCGDWIERHEMSGRLKSEGFYFNNNRNGFWREWYDNDYPNDKNSETMYLQCKLHGVMKCWYPNGYQKSEVSYSWGKLHGIAKHWYPNGYQEDEINYYNEIKHGASIKWNNAGKLISDYYYCNGEKHGTWITYDNNGNVINKSKYYLGQIVPLFET